MSAQLIHDLFEQRKALVEQSRTITDKADAEKRGLTGSEQTQYAGLDEDLRGLDAKIDRTVTADLREETADASFRSLGSRPEVPSQRGASQPSSWLPGLTEYRNLLAEQRAVGTAGAFIPVAYSGRFFDQIRKRVGVLDAGPVIMPIDHAGSLKIPAVTSSITTTITAEGAAITASDPGLNSITLDPKKIAALTIIDSEAMDDSNPALRDIVANSLMRDMAVELDRQLVAADGSSGQMTGLLNQSGFTAGPASATNGTPVGFAMLADTLGAYDTANLDPDKAAWLMHARTWAAVRKIVDSQNRPIFSVDPTNGLKASIWGKPVYISNNIPINQTQGSSSLATSIVLADFSQVVVGVSRDVEIQMSTDAYFSTDQIGLRATCRYDIGLAQPTAVVKTTGVIP